MNEHATAAAALRHLSTRNGIIGERARLALLSLDACWLLLSNDHPSAAYVVSRAMLEQHLTNRMVWQRSGAGAARQVTAAGSQAPGSESNSAAAVPPLDATGRQILGVDNDLDEEGLVQARDTWDRYLKFDDALASLIASESLQPVHATSLAHLYSFLSGFAHPSTTAARIAGDGVVTVDSDRRHAATEVGLAVLLFVSWLDAETLRLAEGAAENAAGQTDWLSVLGEPHPRFDISYLGRSIDPITVVLRQHQEGGCQEGTIRAMTR